ncbi:MULTISPECIES: 20S proteasome subunit (alpha or beta) [unclassified Clostridium]|uniref:20S proteasome subunit (alpha or beta) n=1 Tax=unclassified Clostridium TaxID=2614128 RepID=UPI0002975316|nr:MULTISPECIES: 20S proteasome subunit (alpha or beta) [unclassified Clostridium]EKQ52394.1 MAG: 20S proteasome subunit (alpha or beta) [Clostridium sp. Maddingley MBC34-26]
MTMILSCKYMDKGFLIADSRVTWKQKSNSIFEDTLQKILPLDSHSVIGYCGDITTAELIVRKLREHAVKKMKSNKLYITTKDITRISRHYHGIRKKITELDCEVAFILARIESAGNIEFIKYCSPYFKAINISERLEVIGSGQVIKGEMVKQLDNIDKEVKTYRMFGLALISKIEDELKKNSVDTVGGFFQVIVLGSDGIFPFGYNSVSINPGEIPNSKSISIGEHGEWVQEDFSNNSKITLCEPMFMNKYPKEMRFKDFHINNKISPIYKWHLNYFIVCSNINKDNTDGAIEFSEVTSVLGIGEFPIEVNLKIAIGLWGTRGEHELKIIANYNVEQVCIFNQSISIKNLLDEVDFEIPVNLIIRKPGPIFLECTIKDQIIGRHCIYIGDIRLDLQRKRDIEKIKKTLISQQENCLDPVIENNGLPMMMYQFVSRNAVAKESILRIESEIQRVFSYEYPLKIFVYIISGIAMPKGEREMEIRLINAVTQETTIINKEPIISRSSCKIINASGILELEFKNPGIYYVNTYIDNYYIGTRLLYADDYDKIKEYELEVEEDVIQQKKLIFITKPYN